MCQFFSSVCPSVNAAGSSSRQRPTRLVFALCLAPGSARSAASATAPGQAALWCTPPYATGKPRPEVCRSNFTTHVALLCCRASRVTVSVAVVTDVALTGLFDGETVDNNNGSPEAVRRLRANQDVESGRLVERGASQKSPHTVVWLIFFSSNILLLFPGDTY